MVRMDSRDVFDASPVVSGRVTLGDHDKPPNPLELERRQKIDAGVNDMTKTAQTCSRALPETSLTIG